MEKSYDVSANWAIPSSTNVNIKVEYPNSVEAAKLLRDLEKEVQQNIEKSFVLSNNEFECNIFKLRSTYNNIIHYKIIFKLNNKAYNVDVDIDSIIFMKNSKESAINSIVSAIVAKMAETIVVEHFIETPTILKELLEDC
jgi:hypothetical protein